MSDKIKALLKQASFDKEASLKEYAKGALKGIKEVSRKKERAEKVRHFLTHEGLSAASGAAGTAAYVHHKNKKQSEVFRDLVDEGYRPAEALRLMKQAGDAAMMDGLKAFGNDAKQMVGSVGKALAKGFVKHPVAYTGIGLGGAGTTGLIIGHSTSNQGNN